MMYKQNCGANMQLIRKEGPGMKATRCRCAHVIMIRNVSTEQDSNVTTTLNVLVFHGMKIMKNKNYECVPRQKWSQKRTDGGQ